MPTNLKLTLLAFHHASKQDAILKATLIMFHHAGSLTYYFILCTAFSHFIVKIRQQHCRQLLLNLTAAYLFSQK